MVLRSRLALLAASLATLAAACSIERAPSGRPGGAGGPSEDSAVVAGVTEALRLYYARLTARDWASLAQSFWPRATISHIRGDVAGPPASSQVETTVIEEAIREAAAMKDCPASFDAEPMHLAVTTYGDLADAWATYRFHCGLTRDSVTTHYGIDAFHLLRHGEAWRITDLTFTHEIAGEPLSHQ